VKAVRNPGYKLGRPVDVLGVGFILVGGLHVHGGDSIADGPPATPYLSNLSARMVVILSVCCEAMDEANTCVDWARAEDRGVRGASCKGTGIVHKD